MGQAFKHVMEPVPRVLVKKPDLPVTVDEVLSQGLAKEPSDRFSTATILATAFEAAITQPILNPVSIGTTLTQTKAPVSRNEVEPEEPPVASGITTIYDAPDELEDEAQSPVSGQTTVLDRTNELNVERQLHVSGLTTVLNTIIENMPIWPTLSLPADKMSEVVLKRRRKIILFLVLAIAGISCGIWFLQGNDPEESNTLASIANPTAKQLPTETINSELMLIGIPQSLTITPSILDNTPTITSTPQSTLTNTREPLISGATSTPTRTLAPSATPSRIPIPSPTITPEVLSSNTPVGDSTMYDSFDNTTFDGVINDDLWGYWDDRYPHNFSQQNGTLKLASSAPTALIARKHINLLIRIPTFYEMKIMVSDADSGGIGLKLHGQLSGDNYWTTNCGIYAPPGRALAWAFCDDGEYKNVNGSSSGYIGGKDVNLNTWHTFRVEFNPEQQTVTYFIDGEAQGNIIFPEIETARMSLVIDSLTVSGTTTAYIDEVRYGPLE